VAVNVFLTSATVVLNHFAEGGQIQTYEFLESRTKIITTRQLTHFVLLYYRCLLHQILEVLLKDTAHRKESIATSQMSITSAPVLKFQLNFGSGSFNLSLGGENDVSRVKRGRWNKKV